MRGSGRASAEQRPNSNTGNPIQQTERLLASEVIRPALEAEKIPWYGGHAFRRGLATNLHRLGVSDKVIQQILRHANGPPQLIFT